MSPLSVIISQKHFFLFLFPIFVVVADFWWIAMATKKPLEGNNSNNKKPQISFVKLYILFPVYWWVVPQVHKFIICHHLGFLNTSACSLTFARWQTSCATKHWSYRWNPISSNKLSKWILNCESMNNSLLMKASLMKAGFQVVQKADDITLHIFLLHKIF